MAGNRQIAYRALRGHSRGGRPDPFRHVPWFLLHRIGAKGTTSPSRPSASARALSLGGVGVPLATGVLIFALATRRELAGHRRKSQGARGTPTPPYRKGRSLAGRLQLRLSPLPL